MSLELTMLLPPGPARSPKGPRASTDPSPSLYRRFTPLVAPGTMPGPAEKLLATSLTDNYTP